MDQNYFACIVIYNIVVVAVVAVVIVHSGCHFGLSRALEREIRSAQQTQQAMYNYLDIANGLMAKRSEIRDARKLMTI